MKTFNDIEFGPHPNGAGKLGRIFFPNGYGVSVVRFSLGSFGYGSYTDNEEQWELAVLKGNSESWGLCYTTPITNDVLGRLSEKEVTEIMYQVQELQIKQQTNP